MLTRQARRVFLALFEAFHTVVLLFIFVPPSICDAVLLRSLPQLVVSCRHRRRLVLAVVVAVVVSRRTGEPRGRSAKAPIAFAATAAAAAAAAAAVEKKVGGQWFGRAEDMWLVPLGGPLVALLLGNTVVQVNAVTFCGCGIGYQVVHVLNMCTSADDQVLGRAPRFCLLA